MQQKPFASAKNCILSRLSDDDAALLKPDLVPVELALRQVLEQPNKPIQHAYFIEFWLWLPSSRLTTTNGWRSG